MTKPILRSFDDFLELHRKLRSKIPENEIPKLPKIGFSIFNQSSFLEQRKQDLQLFLDRVNSQNYLFTCPYYLDFVTPDVTALINRDTGADVPWKPLPSSEVLLIYAPNLPPNLNNVPQDLSEAAELEQKAISLLNEIRAKIFATKSPAETAKLFSSYKEKIDVTSKQIDDVLTKFSNLKKSDALTSKLPSDVRTSLLRYVNDAEEVAKSSKKFLGLLSRAEDYAISSAAKVRYFRATRKIPELLEWVYWYEKEIDRFSRKILSVKLSNEQIEKRLGDLRFEIQKDISGLNRKFSEESEEEKKMTEEEKDDSEKVNGKKYEMVKDKLNELVTEVDTIEEILKKGDLTFYLDLKISKFEKEVDELIKNREENKEEIDRLKKVIDDFVGSLDTGMAEQNEAVRRINEEILSKI